MKIFIAGATGAIGHPLISRLVAAGYDVIGMTSSERGLQTLREAGVEGVVANALDAQAVQVAMNKARPDAVIEELTSPPKTLHARRNACCCRSRPHGETRGRTEPSERGEGGRRTAVYCAVHRILLCTWPGTRNRNGAACARCFACCFRERSDVYTDRTAGSRFA